MSAFIVIDVNTLDKAAKIRFWQSFCGPTSDFAIFLFESLAADVSQGRLLSASDCAWSSLCHLTWGAFIHAGENILPEDQSIPIEYGITRPVNTRSFTDMYFGEFICLGGDMADAPGFSNKLLYLLMPPGWSHTGEHKTARVMKQKARDQTTLSLP